VKFNFFTLPGQLRFSKTRALVLRGAQKIMPVEYMDATFGLRTWKVPKLSGSALTGENVLKAADLITSNLMRQLSGTLGLEEKDLA
jgi:hypothetical protein